MGTLCLGVRLGGFVLLPKQREVFKYFVDNVNQLRPPKDNVNQLRPPQDKGRSQVKFKFYSRNIMRENRLCANCSAHKVCWEVRGVVIDRTC